MSVAVVGLHFELFVKVKRLFREVFHSIKVIVLNSAFEFVNDIALGSLVQL